MIEYSSLNSFFQLLTPVHRLELLFVPNLILAHLLSPLCQAPIVKDLLLDVSNTIYVTFGPLQCSIAAPTSTAIKELAVHSKEEEKKFFSG